MKFLTLVMVMSLFFTVSCKEDQAEKVMHDKEHHHEGEPDHEHDDEHHKEHDHQAHHPDHDPSKPVGQDEHTENK